MVHVLCGSLPKSPPSSDSDQKGPLTQTQNTRSAIITTLFYIQNSTFPHRILHRGWGEQGREGEGLSQAGKSSAGKWIAELSAWQTSMKL